jgi:hypothetical protein
MIVVLLSHTLHKCLKAFVEIQYKQLSPKVVTSDLWPQGVFQAEPQLDFLLDSINSFTDFCEL